MQRHSDKRDQCKFDTKGYSLHFGSHGCYYGLGDSFESANDLSRTTLTMPSSNQLHRQPNGHNSESPNSGLRQEHENVASMVVPPTMGEYTGFESKGDQIGSSKEHTTYSYLEPHSTESMQAHGHRSELIYPELHPVPHIGTAFPFVPSEEPVYVNAKQYHAILRRRQLRAKAEMENRLTRTRKPYLHESRHLHALRRARGCGGRFVNTKKAPKTTPEEGSSAGDSPPLPSPDSDHYGSLRQSDGANFFKWTYHSK